jgi:hypothetical protein
MRTLPRSAGSVSFVEKATAVQKARAIMLLSRRLGRGIMSFHQSPRIRTTAEASVLDRSQPA